MANGLKQKSGFGVRRRRSSRGLPAAATLTLAGVIGLTSAVSAISYTMFSPMPYPIRDQVSMLAFRSGTGDSFSLADDGSTERGACCTASSCGCGRGDKHRPCPDRDATA